MIKGLSKEITRNTDHVLISMSGELTIHSAPDFHKALLDFDTTPDGHWVFDLHNISYIDSAGVGTLVDIFRRSKKNGSRMSLVGMNRQVRSVFEITKLDKFFPIFESVQDALGS
jgi:anti-sigma B factor antagonist